jgi:exopolysaccharide biosynthesis polyprenyl glycosylphosphotransferase
MQLVADIISVLLSYSVQYYIRFNSGLFGPTVNFRFDVFISPAVVLLIYWLLFFWFSGLYKNWYIRSPFDEFFTILRVTFIGSFIIFFIWYLDSDNKEPRMLFLVNFVILSIIVILGRYTARVVQRTLRAKEIVVIPAIIAGTHDKATELYNKIQSATNWGYRIIGCILTYGYDSYQQDDNNGINILGKQENLEEILDKYNPKEVLISEDNPKHSFMLKLVSNCADRKITVKIIPDLYDFFTGQAKTLHLYGIPLIEINTQLLKPWQEIAKRIFDIVFSLIILLIGIPIWFLLALIIKIESKGSVFYLQDRIGKNGKKFKIIKFRSMVQDAEKKSGPKWAQVNDPRVTKVGKFLRKSHLDEMPQFLNVLKGDMSIVGPRPERPVFVEKFSNIVPFYKRRLVVRPGITGWWQVKYTTYVESKEEIEGRLKDDFFYIENMSFQLDIEIILRTIFLVFKGHGQT